MSDLYAGGALNGRLGAPHPRRPLFRAADALERVATPRGDVHGHRARQRAQRSEKSSHEGAPSFASAARAPSRSMGA